MTITMSDCRPVALFMVRVPNADYGRLTSMASREDDAHRLADSGGPYHPTRSIGLASAEDRITDRYHFFGPSPFVPLG